MEHVRYHETNVSNDLVHVTLSKEDILNELIDTSGDDMKQRHSNDAKNLSGRYAIILIGEMQDKCGREKLRQLWTRKRQMCFRWSSRLIDSLLSQIPWRRFDGSTASRSRRSSSWDMPTKRNNAKISKGKIKTPSTVAAALIWSISSDIWCIRRVIWFRSQWEAKFWACLW